jgi:hypothetical protein
MADQDVEIPQSQTDSSDVTADIRAAINEARGDSEAPVKLTLDRPRDANTGQFTEKPRDAEPPKETKRPTLTLPEKKQAPAQDTGEQQQAAQTAEKPPAGAPNSWSAPMKAKWGGIDPEVGAYIQQREVEMQKRLSQQDEFTDLGRRAKEAAAPYEAIIRSEGGDTLGMLKDYLNYAYVFRSANPQQKVAALHQLARQFNIPLSVPAQPAQGPQSAIELQLAQANQRIEQMDQRWQQFTTQQAQQEQDGYESVFADFAREPGHEHFERLRPMMGRLMQQGMAADLEQAYETAVYMDPELRAMQQQAASQAQAATRNEGLQGKADAARRAAVSVRGAPGSSKPVVNGGSVGSVEDDLRAAFRQHAGRV